jgi:hypothetical protein
MVVVSSWRYGTSRECIYIALLAQATQAVVTHTQQSTNIEILPPRTKKGEAPTLAHSRAGVNKYIAISNAVQCNPPLSLLRCPTLVIVQECRKLLVIWQGSPFGTCMLAHMIARRCSHGGAPLSKLRAPQRKMRSSFVRARAEWARCTNLWCSRIMRYCTTQRWSEVYRTSQALQSNHQAAQVGQGHTTLYMHDSAIGK